MVLLIATAALVGGGQSACSTGDVLGNIAGAAVGDSRLADVVRAGVSGATDTLQQMNTKFSPEQEYFLGRAVAAEAIAHYGLDPNEAHQRYVKTIGEAIVTLSTRLSGTYGGYHFAVLDSDEANGLSAPGGYVFITRGALLRCRTEDEVAAILCHELGHVSLKHGEKVIREGRVHQAAIGGIVSALAAGAGAGENGLTESMATYMKEVAGDFARQLRETGYGAGLEFEADQEGSFLLYDVGYDAGALQRYLKAAPGRQQDTWATHPPADARIRALQPVVEKWGGSFDGGLGARARGERFRRQLSGAEPVSGPVRQPEPAPLLRPPGPPVPAQPLSPSEGEASRVPAPPAGVAPQRR